MSYKQSSAQDTLIMYIDMNSYFASCEQQDQPAWRGKPLGVCTHDSPYACVIAPSSEAKQYGISTGMRLHECRKLCPQIIPVIARPWRYRQIHRDIMQILKSYCEEVIPKSIDEAVLNLTSYQLVYRDPVVLALQIKAAILRQYNYLRCSVGIASNVLLAKLASDLQKPDGLVQLTRENLDDYLGRLSLTDLPGIARKNARRLELAGIRTPLQMRYTSPALLRRAFGGITGEYWHARLNFKEVDMYQNPYRSISAMRTVSAAQRGSHQAQEGLLIALCVRLEQRMVGLSVFCRDIRFFIRYTNLTGWDTHIRLAQPLQDAMDIRKYILSRIRDFERTQHVAPLLGNQTKSLGITLTHFVREEHVSHTLFEPTIRQDILRKIMYRIRNQYGSKSIRKAAEIIAPDEMKDAIGFGSVKNMDDSLFLLEEDS